MAQGFQSDIPPAINQTAKKYIRGMMKGKRRWNRLYGSRDKEVMHKTANKMAMGEMSKMPPTYYDIYERAKSRAQQRFFGMVRAAQKGEMDSPSPEVSKAASSMSRSDVKKYAKTKHDKLPEKKKVEEGNKSGDSSLRDWFKKSKSSDGTPGWVQLGGKYAGKPCAKQPGQTTKPKCGSSKMKRNLDKGEEEAAFRRKQKEDPNPDRKGKAINVRTEDKELNTIAKELDKASKMHASQAERVRKHVKKMKSFKEATYPSDFRNPDGSKRSVAKKKTGRPNAQGDYGKKDIQERGDFWHPDPDKDRKLGGPGANQRAREDRGASSGTRSSNEKKLRPGESYMQYAKRMKNRKESVEMEEGMGDVAIKAIRATQGKKPAELSKRTALIRKIKQKQLDSYLKKRDAKKKERVTNVGMGEELEWLTEEQFDEAAGEKDACYKKVKSRYKVWPSAYASGALVKCRKVGAANWGNSKKEEFDRFQQVQEKCWKGYKRVGMKKKGGRLVPNCVPEEVQNEGAAWTKKSGKSESGGLNEKGRKSYERENPGSDLKAPSKKVGNPRRASFCARMRGMKKKLTSKKTASDPDSRINKSLRAWNC